MASQEAIFLNTRARLQRLSDAKFFAGWVRDFTRTDLVVRTAAPAKVCSGEIFMVQVHGHTSTALFRAILRAVGEKELYFAIPEPVKFLTASEQVRVSIQGVTAKVGSNGDVSEATVVDLSAGGAGLMMSTELHKGDSVDVQFSTPLGDVECAAEVRYCKPDLVEEGTYRVGIRLTNLGRIERGRWNRLLEQDAA